MQLSSVTENDAPLFIRRVEEIARHYPEHVALWVAGETYSYEQLWQASTLIAGTLMHKEGEFCALIASKSFASYAAILGIMRAGKGYLPVASDDPVDRIVAALTQIHCSSLLSDHDDMAFAGVIASRCPDLTPVPLPEIMTSAETAAGHNLPSLHKHSPCSLLFTSGSTGVPKGVITSHTAFAAYLDSALAILRPGPDDRISQLTPLTFDFSLHDIGLAWCSGAALYAIDRNDSYSLPGFVSRHQLTFWSSVPSGWLSIERLGALRPGNLASLRTVVMGGEPVPLGLIARCRQASPQAEFFNIYGPTESAVAVTISRWSDDYHALGEWPLGTSLTGNRLLLIDDNQQPVTPGERGQICISGVQVAQGYVGVQPGGASRFISLPGQQGMWYLTGDDGIQDARHGLLFRGRRDAQWQVRGCRVERGEIEDLMRQVAETPHVAVLPITGENALVISMAAFVEGSPFSVKEMRQRCHQFLPDYLFPGQIIEMSLPRNRNMKTDYLALHHHLAQVSCGAKSLEVPDATCSD